MQVHRLSDPFLNRATTSMLNRLILSSIQISLSLPTDPLTQSCSSWQFSEAMTDKKNGFAHQAWIFVSVKWHSHFLNRPLAVGRSGLNLASRVTVGRASVLPDFLVGWWFFSLKHLHVSYNFSFVGCHFKGIGDCCSRMTVCLTSAGEATVSRWSPISWYTI